MQLWPVASFFDIGTSPARATARAQGREAATFVAVGLMLFLPLGLLFCAAMFAFSFVADGWFHVDAGRALRSAAPLLIAFPFGFVGLQLAQGRSRLHAYSLTTVLAQAVYLVLVLLLIGATHLNVTVVLLARSAAFFVGGVVLIVWLGPQRRAGQWR